jgi:parvulin-like peptidyl-prolyl isomerase
VLNLLEKNVREINSVVMPEVKKAIGQWKDRSAFSSLIVLGFIATLAIFAEIQAGILELLIDPIIGPAIIVILIVIMTPLHVLFSRIQAKVIISQLNARQKELHLMENLAGNFEKNLTFSRMMLPISEPIGWNKKTKLRLTQISNKTKELVQLLNDNFSTYDGLSLTGHLDYPDFK